MDNILPLTYTVDETISPDKFPIDVFYRFNHRLPYRWFICDEKIVDWTYIVSPQNYRAQDTDKPTYQAYKQYYSSSLTLKEFHVHVTEARINKNYQYSDGKQMIQPFPSSTSIEGYELLLNSAAIMTSKLSIIDRCIKRCRQARAAVRERQEHINRHLDCILKYRRVAPLVLEPQFLQLALLSNAILELSPDLGRYLRCKRAAVCVCVPSATIPLTFALANSIFGSCSAINRYFQSCNTAAAFLFLQRCAAGSALTSTAPPSVMHSAAGGVAVTADTTSQNEVLISFDQDKKTFCRVTLVDEYLATSSEGKHTIKADAKHKYLPSDIEISASEESSDADCADKAGKAHDAHELSNTLPDLSFMQTKSWLKIEASHGSLNPDIIRGIIKLAHVQEENPVVILSDVFNVAKACDQKLKQGDKICLESSLPHRMMLITSSTSANINSSASASTTAGESYVLYSKGGKLYEML